MKCFTCKGEFNRDALFKHSDNKNYCSKCLCERKARDELNETIKRIFNVKKPTQIMNNQMANYRKKGYTTQGMVNCLYYVFDVLNKSADKPTLGLIPYYYEKANQIFSTIEQPSMEINNKVEVVESTYQKPTIKVKTIDISEL